MRQPRRPALSAPSPRLLKRAVNGRLPGGCRMRPALDGELRHEGRHHRGWPVSPGCRRPGGCGTGTRCSLEADHRVGGRIRSERRGPYWLNWGGHVFAGPGSSTDTLLNEVGVAAVAVPGSLKGLSMNGKFIRKRRIETYPFRIPMSLAARVGRADRRAQGRRRRCCGTPTWFGSAPVSPARSGSNGSTTSRTSGSFHDFVGDLPDDAAALFKTTVTRSARRHGRDLGRRRHRLLQPGAGTSARASTGASSAARPP